MEAEDTIMSTDRMGLACISNPDLPMGQAIAKEQAKISFKEGAKEALWRYAWWKDGTQYVGTTGTTLYEALANLEV